ncbi:DUF433 domain-containing protein [Tundrisphaera lichenicola]|uniref:DUF433 domain-containing protein n=1 Tax=Tundrisphaera lichenicola TaxID=2029860 RepID=UPI003EBB5629
MELKASHFDVATTSSRMHSNPSGLVEVFARKTNPRSRTRNRSTRANTFQDFSGSVLLELNPRGPLESVLVDHVISSAWRLKRALVRQQDRELAEADVSGRETQTPKRYSPSAADQATRSVKEAIDALECIRLSRVKHQSKSSIDVTDFDCQEIESNEWPILPFDALDDLLEVEPAEQEQDALNWSDRLVFDFDISDLSPVIKGTWITVSHIVSLIVDGFTWADILRSHPELTEEDVRICVAYAVAQDQNED